MLRRAVVFGFGKGKTNKDKEAIPSFICSYSLCQLYICTPPCILQKPPNKLSLSPTPSPFPLPLTYFFLSCLSLSSSFLTAILQFHQFPPIKHGASTAMFIPKQKHSLHSPLSTPHSPLPTPHSPLPTPHSPLTATPTAIVFSQLHVHLCTKRSLPIKLSFSTVPIVVQTSN
ncbi:hypothetical protein VNO78_08092 [Psophocarpus tetragonolobus]|uniref:Uncharacterized protein n=1 Tax=Psophocarpus tetragonolobus TaxID=3891 RepID=A0AAN9SUI3_PSOTE